MGVLSEAGFAPIQKPLTVAGTEFEFEAAARGTQSSHDLVLVATERLPRPRLQRLMAGLARSLDLAGSRRPMSLVLMGAITASERTELERYARVLHIPSAAPTVAEIEDAVAVLLPLKLPNADLVHGSDPVNEVMTELGVMKATGEHIALIRAADDGAEAVQEALRRYLNDATGWVDDAEDNDD